MPYEIDLSLQAASASIEANNYKTVTVSLTEVAKSDILDHFDVDDVLSHFGVNDILDEIGEDAVKKYFKLDESGY
jgi:hypothetical protein